ncbi:UDP-glucose:undecaprenyl-phosphate glucose-1-phosphate transferase [bacterium BMS3Abin01]|nr:UDP-glucose:undecaprenyl-phosphate glucose-1-phosphate transferase [bacterium BMS3Abin01]
MNILTSHRFTQISLVVGDFLGVLAGYRLAWAIYFQFGIRYEDVGEAAPSFEFYMAIALVILPLYWLLFKLHGLYRFRLNLSLLEVLPQIFSAITEASLMLLALTIFIFPPTHYSRNVIVISWVCVIFSVSLLRLLIYMLQKSGRRHGRYAKNTLVLGAGTVGVSCARKLIRNPELGLNFVGFLDEKPSGQARELGSYPVYQDYSKLEEVLEEQGIQHMVVAFSRDRHDKTVELMERCFPYGVDFTIVPRLYELFSDRVGVEHIRGLPVVGLQRSNISGLQGFVKRGMDIVISLLLLVLLSPVLLLTALAIKIDSRGPLLYRQTRLGKNEKPFEMLKFRSMRKGSDREAQGWTTAGDARRTRVGRVIRPLAIDELPQLINVIQGDMSLVGPRPEQPDHARKFSRRIPSYSSRHRVRPGLTGWAQINGLRGDTDISERAEYDIYYIENWSPWFDVKIMLKTLIAFVKRDA